MRWADRSSFSRWRICEAGIRRYGSVFCCGRVQGWIKITSAVPVQLSAGSFGAVGSSTILEVASAIESAGGVTVGRTITSSAAFVIPWTLSRLLFNISPSSCTCR